MKRISVSLKMVIITVTFYIIPIFLDLPIGRFNHDFFWLLYLIPVIGASYHFGRKVGFHFAAIGMTIYSSWELREFFLEYNIHHHDNLFEVIVIDIILVLTVLLVGTLSDKIKNEQEQGQKKNEYFEKVIQALTTNQIKSEESFRASKEMLLRTFREIPVPLFIITCDDGTFLEVNESFKTLTGYTREELLSRKSDVFHEMIRTTDSTSSNLETRFLTKNGQTRTGLFSFQPLQLFTDTTYMLCTCIDITDLNILREELTRLDRLNLIGVMAAGLGHEIRNPLTTVRGYLQFLGAKKEFAQAKDHFDLMISELDHSNAIITEFLSLAKTKPNETELEDYNINEIIKRLYPLMVTDAMCDGNIIQLNLNPIPNIKLNVKEIRQLIINLVRNGLEAMKSDGILLIRTYVEDRETILAIQDHGCGISPEVLNKLGTPFLSTKDTGTGLGLAVCYGIAKRHNAALNVQTGPTGTTFYLKFHCQGNCLFPNRGNKVDCA